MNFPLIHLGPQPRVRSDGYVMVGKAYEHRLVMERMLGRKLDRLEQVHHRNGNKSDNRQANLEVVSISEHRISHRSLLVDSEVRELLLLGYSTTEICERGRVSTHRVGDIRKTLVGTKFEMFLCTRSAGSGKHRSKRSPFWSQFR